MKPVRQPAKVLSLFLILVAIHSLLVGFCLIASPVSFIEWLGFPMKEKFFAVQGGVFHVVVSIAYLMAARDIQSGKNLVVFAILAKFIAAVFLLTYYLAWNPIPLVLVSGLGDLAMGALIAFLYRLVRKPVSKSI